MPFYCCYFLRPSLLCCLLLMPFYCCYFLRPSLLCCFLWMPDYCCPFLRPSLLCCSLFWPSLLCCFFWMPYYCCPFLLPSLLAALSYGPPYSAASLNALLLLSFLTALPTLLLHTPSVLHTVHKNKAMWGMRGSEQDKHMKLVREILYLGVVWGVMRNV